MTTAKIALDSLWHVAQTEAENAHAAMNTAGMDEQVWAEARGLYSAYHAIASNIERMQAEGFTDPDPLTDVTALQEATHNTLVATQRSHRTRIALAQLRDMYQPFVALIPTDVVDPTISPLLEVAPVIGMIVLTWTVVDSEQESHTDDMLNRMREFLAALQAMVVTESSSNGFVQ